MGTNTVYRYEVGSRMRLPKMTEYAHDWLARVVQAGDVVIDATCGNGYDALFLAQAVGDEGRVYAFDIQEQALATTEERLRAADALQQVTLIHDSHAHVQQYVPHRVKAILFNLGYLPGGDKDITTTVESSLIAIQAGLELLEVGGVLVVVVYPGHTAGAVERAAIDPWAAGLDARTYQVTKIHYHNQGDHAPYTLAILRRS